MKRKAELVIRLEDVEHAIDLNLDIPDSIVISDIGHQNHADKVREFQTALGWHVFGVVCNVNGEFNVGPSNEITEAIEKVMIKMGDADSEKHGKRTWDLPTYNDFVCALKSLKITK